MRKILSITILLTISIGLNAQHLHQASLDTNNIMHSKLVKGSDFLCDTKKSLTQMAGFPIVVAGNASFKNMRGLTLADIDGDGIQDIIFAANSTLYAWSFHGQLWQKTLIGTAIYPAAVADINNDGWNEIVQLTGNSTGRIYMVDRDGNDITGWPINYSNHWLFCSPVLSDLDNDNLNEIIFCERVGTAGNIRVLRYDGTSFSSNWPVLLDGYPAVTPSIADVDNDGEKEIVAYSTKSKYIFKLDGTAETGFPVTTAPAQSYSYQSPAIADLNADDHCEIIGATHGDSPQFYVMEDDGGDFTGWPKSVPDSSWTYSTPSVVKINGEWNIFLSRPIGADADDMLYGRDINGNMLPGFPIVKPGGLEGFISVADINDDNIFELVFGSNLLDSTDCGFIHAYRTDNGQPIAGFPIRPRGWTFMNGINIGDINGDDKMDLVALSYTNSFGANTDSVYINVYETNSAYSAEKVLWGTYKGNNMRTGFVGDNNTSIQQIDIERVNAIAYPNPATESVTIEWQNPESSDIIINISDITGRQLIENQIGEKPAGKCTYKANLGSLETGFYIISIITPNKTIGRAEIIKI